MDIRINNDNWKFYCRTCGVIKQDNKFLIMRVNQTNHYHIPGGHMEIGEDSKTAVIREIKEEIGCDVTVEDLLCINENFYNIKDTNYHGIEFYYLLKPEIKLPMNDYSKEELDKGEILKLDFKWVDKDMLKNIELKPDNLKELILNDKIYTFNHFIKRNNLK